MDKLTIKSQEALAECRAGQCSLVCQCIEVPRSRRLAMHRGERPVQVTLSPRLAWALRLENGMQVEMGREQVKAPVGARLQRFIEVYPETVGKRATRPSVVDLRYPNGFAMRIAGDAKRK